MKLLSVTFRVARAVCGNCGEPIMSIDGWIHEGTGSVLCAIQPPPLVAVPDTEGRYSA